MARYIDADKLYTDVKTKTNPYGKPTLDYESGVKVLDMINRQPTADVVPKSEVENILDILIKEAGEIAESYKVRIAELNGLEYADRVKSEYIGTQVGALLVQLRIAQLKKKYTESEGNI